jgi:hypothetical protein
MKTISVKVTLKGCEKSDTIKITFKNCAGINQDRNNKLINIFPNPSAGIFTLEFDDMIGLFEIRITDITVKIAYVEKLSLKGTKSSRLFDLSSKPKGIYFLRLADESEIRTKRS